MNFDNKDSFFYRVLKVLELYNLPDIISLNQELPTKTAWKTLVNRTIRRTGEIHYYKTLNVNQHLNSLLMKTFPWERYILLWVSSENSVTDVRKAIVKARILTGTCLLQTNTHKFSQYSKDPTCKLCKQQEEDIFHMLLYCLLLTDTRLSSFKVLRDFVKHHIGDEKWKNLFSTKEDLVQLIIDSRKFSNLFDNSDILLQIERHSRNLCFQLYNKRLSILRNLEDGFLGGAA